MDDEIEDFFFDNGVAVNDELVVGDILVDIERSLLMVNMKSMVEIPAYDIRGILWRPEERTMNRSGEGQFCQSSLIF